MPIIDSVPQGPLTRSLIRLRLPASRAGGVPTMVGEDALREGLRNTLARRPAGATDLRVFAYGSLMWQRDGFAWEDVRVARLPGLARRYCVWDEHDRGVPGSRGLTLAVEPAPEACAGVTLRLPENDGGAALWAVWQREMAPGFYRPRWIEAAHADGPATALAFVADPAAALYAGALPADEVAELVARGCGPHGTAAEYLLDATETLGGHGLRDPYLDRVARDVAVLLERAPGLP